MEKTAGIDFELDRGLIPPQVRKLRDTYDMKPNAPFFMKEFGFLSGERWLVEGKLQKMEEIHSLCAYDGAAVYAPYNLGWCEPAFLPAFDEIVLEDRGETELVRDGAGRKVVFFKGSHNGYMPTYVDHPVKDFESWEKLCAWRLNPKSPARLEQLRQSCEEGVKHAKAGFFMQQTIIGGYMYLRALIGPEDLLYMFYDNAPLIHECMRAWLELNDAVLSETQKHYTLDEIFLGEDICYNHGSLISPDMMEEFLLPYYQQLIENAKKRQRDKDRKLYIYIDTDGDCREVIPFYNRLGMKVMSPFEVASGCDVVEIGRQYPELIMSGGIDKRELAKGKDAIDRMLERIIPPMKERGGYIPTCDHDVPEEVDFEDYIYFRKRLIEYST